MARERVQVRVMSDLLARADAYAVARGSTRTAVIESALEAFLADAQGGVPDLAAPADETPRPSPAGRRAKSEAVPTERDPGPASRQGASRPPVQTYHEMMRERQARLNRGRP